MAEKYLIGASKFRGTVRRLHEKQMPFAISLAINAVATDIKRATDARLTNAFEAPKAFTKRSGFILRSKKTNLEAIVGVKDIQSIYLSPQELGGRRRHTRFEKRLMFAGVIDPGEYVIPATRVTRGVFTQVLSQLGALREGSATNSKRSQRARKRAGAMFVTGEPGVGKGSGLPRGIWRRKGIFIEPVFWITRKTPTYTARLRYGTTAQKVFRSTMTGHMKSSFRRAVISSTL